MYGIVEQAVLVKKMARLNPCQGSESLRKQDVING